MGPHGLNNKKPTIKHKPAPNPNPRPAPKSATKPKPAPKPAPAPALDRFALYELCVQQPAASARFLRALHPGKPTILAEDFCGAAAISREWVALAPRLLAIATDLDPEPLSHASSHPRLRLVCRDVLKVRDPADIVAGFNFALGELPTRAALVAYLKNTRRRLRPKGFAAFDLYGGPTAWMMGATSRFIDGPGGEEIEYIWDQQGVMPWCSRVHNAIHFRVTPASAKGTKGPNGSKGSSSRPASSSKPRVLKNAFNYHWRLWTVAEVREAMAEAGFRSTEVHAAVGSAIDNLGELHAAPSDDHENHPDDFVAYIVARV